MENVCYGLDKWCALCDMFLFENFKTFIQFVWRLFTQFYRFHIKKKWDRQQNENERMEETDRQSMVYDRIFEMTHPIFRFV